MSTARGPAVHLRRLARTLGLGALLGATALAACGDGDARRREIRGDTEGRRSQQVGRRGGTPIVEDTTSLLTTVGGDSLIGAARGAGGVATLRGECAACHQGVHQVDLGRGPGPAPSCLECHESDHEPVQAFYAGAVTGVDVPADTMFVARVACAGCHVDSTFAQPAGAPRHAAYDRMCTSCHGERFEGMLADWRGGVEWRTRAVDAYVTQAAADGRLARGDARGRVQAARAAMRTLRTAGALHNVRGADRLFRAAVDSTVAAYRLAGLAAPPRPALGSDPVATTCLGCHYGVEAARDTVFGQTFDHASHVVRANVACKDCHTDEGYFLDGKSGGAEEDKDVNPRHGKTTVSAKRCNDCHHSPTQTLSCTACHAYGDQRMQRPVRVSMALNLRPENAPKSRDVPFSHPQHREVKCESCHKSTSEVRQVVGCRDCHDDHHTERAKNYASCTACHTGAAQAKHTRDDHLRCTSCHVRQTVARLLPTRTLCLTCHVKQVDHEPGKECSTCHMQATPQQLKQRILAGRDAPGRGPIARPPRSGTGTN